MAKTSTDARNGVPPMQPPSSQIVSEEKFAECAHQTVNITNNKRIIACCDGTWNNSNVKEKKGNYSTNVSRLSSAIAHKCCTGMPQIVHYTRGAGTDSSSEVGKLLGAAFGKGVIQDIADTYRFICDNFNPGDEIIILGFSRGAFTARSVSGLVCNIGLLNRVGLSQFGKIFHDYQNFAQWKEFNKDEHLEGFTLSNFKRIKQRDGVFKELSDTKLEEELNKEKKRIFKTIVECKGEKSNDQKRLRKMAECYAEALKKHEMILCEQKQKGVWSPTEVEVKAVGVWDTVGSLGFPKMPSELIPRNRRAQELRFASLDVHPRVQNAFHALALDEWRTAFQPTLWGMKDNDRTKLRQVWFPGGHSNVGGGFPDQQMATIAMAWMADQLTSIGVEFSTPEMTRVFYTLEYGVKPRKWALGRISNPSVITTITDQAMNAFYYPLKKWRGENTAIGGRTPGKYKDDNRKDFITSPNEFIHPSARIRYMCREGLGLDDKGDWDCAALTKNGYTLEKIDGPPELGDTYPQKRIASTYATLSGRVSSVNRSQKSDIQSHGDHTLVVQQVPFEQDLWHLDKAENQWVWTQGTGKDKKTLQEERIGMWERLFIKINDKMVKREEDAAQAASSSDQSKKPGLVRKVYDKVHNTVNDRWQSAKGRVGRMFSRTIAGKMFDRTVGKLLRPAEKPKPSDYPKAHGYYDMISWQRGDPNPKPPPPGKVNQKPAKD